MSQADDAAGVFETIDSEASAHKPELVKVDTGETAEESTTEAEETNNQNTNTEEVEEQETGTTDEGTTETEATTTETNEHSQTETQTEVADDFDWKATLPPAPQPYQGPEPEIDPETGQITNMTPAEYATYMRETTKAELRQEAYGSYIENAALDAAEKILPELKTNQAVRTLVQNARIASVINGQQIDAFEAAKQVREALGLAPAKIQQAKAEGAQNAKASITVQKNAALETGSSNKGDAEADTVTKLQKRIKRGDDEAFAELLGLWEKDGKLK